MGQIPPGPPLNLGFLWDLWLLSAAPAGSPQVQPRGYHFDLGRYDFLPPRSSVSSTSEGPGPDSFRLRLAPPTSTAAPPGPSPVNKKASVHDRDSFPKPRPSLAPEPNPF